MKRLSLCLDHAQIVLALVFLVIEILDWYNPYMGFRDLGVSAALMLAFCLTALARAVPAVFQAGQAGRRLHPPPSRAGRDDRRLSAGPRAPGPARHDRCNRMEMHTMDEIRYRPAADAGLTAGQVRARQAEGKQNLPPEPFTKTTGQIIRENVCTLFNLFNVLIALALASVGAWSNMLFILIIALNTLIGIVQELHAKRLVDRLSLLSMPSARVIRDRAAAEIPVEEVVLEDVIELEAGRQVCADAVILTGQVEVDESLLTGESDPVHRAVPRLRAAGGGGQLCRPHRRRGPTVAGRPLPAAGGHAPGDLVPDPAPGVSAVRRGGAAAGRGRRPGGGIDGGGPAGDAAQGPGAADQRQPGGGHRGPLPPAGAGPAAVRPGKPRVYLRSQKC